MIYSKLLSGYNGIVHGFGTVRDSLLDVQNACRSLDGSSAAVLIQAEQVHDAKVAVVHNNMYTGNAPIRNIDGMITRDPSTAVVVRSADCIPILMYDPVKKVCGAVHAGRRSITKGIVENTIQMFKGRFSSQIENMVVALGPAICKKHYPVDQKTQDIFVSVTGIKQDKGVIDLVGAVKKKFIDLGLPEKNLEIIDICTFEDDDFHSYRQQKTEHRQYSFIGLKHE